MIGDRRPSKLGLYLLASTQICLMLALLTVMVQLNLTQHVPAPIIEVQPIADRIVTDAYPSISSNLNQVSARVRLMTGSGSAVAISATLAITNHHVVNTNHSTVWVDALDENGCPVSAVFDVVAVDEARDLALLRAPATFKFSKWAKLHKEPMKWGDQIILVGCQNSHLPLPSTGYWIRKMPDGDDQLSVPSFWGASGGGVFDARSGEIAGIMVHWDDACTRGGITVFPNIFYCIPAQWVNDFVEHFNHH